MPATENLPVIFDQLKKIIQKHEKRLVVKADTLGNYYLEAPASEKYQKGLFFGAVQVKKNYVSYHLMPVYMYPGLLDGLSPDLKKHMQGKSCFNFKAEDKALFAELAALTKKSLDKLKQEKLV
jgi:hypothetical protein